MTNEQLQELIRRWKLVKDAPVEMRQVAGPAMLHTAIPLLEELLTSREKRAGIPDEQTLARMNRTELLELIEKLR